MSWFNENDTFPAAWLRNLYPTAVVDDRSIADVQPADVAGHERVHFFGGIGGWEYALELAGWPADRAVWTGSCPCQPFSCAGQGRGFADERHLWPEWLRLIRERRPPTIFGEQVASPAGLAWLDTVRTDLEGEGYAFGAADLCAAGVGAPHIRQRLWFVADAERPGWPEGRAVAGSGPLTSSGSPDRLVLPDSGGRPARNASAEAVGYGRAAQSAGGVGDADDAGSQGRPLGGDRASEWAPWAAGVAMPCLDGKARPVEPGIQPLAHGIPARVGRLRAYGNAIVPQVAATFVRAFMEATS